MFGVKGLFKSLREMIDLEKYASLRSPVHSLDPRVKLITVLLLVFTAISVKSIVSMFFLLAIVLLVALSSGLPMRSFLGRATFFIPIFAAIIALPLIFITRGTTIFSFDLVGIRLVVSREGVEVAVLFVFRVWLCVASVMLLLLTTEFQRLVRGLEKLKVPKTFTMILSMTFRYIYVLIDEALRMFTAKEARTFGKLGIRRRVRLAAGIVSTTFVRSYDRGERVYHAMLARGFDGKSRTLNDLKLRLRDVAFGLTLTVASVTILLIDMGVILPGFLDKVSGFIGNLIGW